MLGIFLMYFIGKRFYDLAGTYDKNQLGFAIAGVASFYVGAFFAGILLAIYFEIWMSTSFEELNEGFLNLIGLPFSLLTCFGFYKFLEHSWKRKPKRFNTDILDEEILE